MLNAIAARTGCEARPLGRRTRVLGKLFLDECETRLLAPKSTELRFNALTTP